MDRSKIKVTDRRMFTEEGELRTDLEDLEDSADESRVLPSSAPPPTPEAQPAGRGAPPLGDAQAAAPDAAAGGGAPAGGPQFLDLVDLLCQQVALALGDPRLGEGAPPPDLRLARIYIDLLSVLQEKTRGNLSAEEAAVLEELIYRFRMLYVEKQRR